jgi:transcriptional regulator with XRE-family HTH domain
MYVKSHIYPLLAAERRRLGLSQQELAARAGLRREKVNRVESKQEDIGLEDVSRLLDALGLVLVVQRKEEAMPPNLPVAPLPQEPGRLVPQAFDKAAFIDGSKARILSWGKVPA